MLAIGVLRLLPVLLRVLRQGELAGLSLRRSVRLRLSVLLLAVGILSLLSVRGLILRPAVLAGLLRRVRLLTRLTVLPGLLRAAVLLPVLRRLLPIGLCRRAVRLLSRLRLGIGILRRGLPVLGLSAIRLLRPAELRLSAIWLLSRLLRLPELPLLLRRRVRLLPLPLAAAGAPGAVRTPGQAGLLGVGAGLPRRRALAGALRRDGPLRGRRLRGLLLGARGLGPRLGARNGPLGGLGLRVRLSGCGFGRGVGHGSARYPTNPQLVTPARDLSPDCGVRYPAVHLARTTTEDAILSLQVCDF